MQACFIIKTTYLALPTRNKHWNVFLCRPLVADSANGQRWWWTYWPYIVCLRRSFSKEPPFTGFLTAFYGDFFEKTKKHFNIKSWHFHKQCNCGTVCLQGPLLKYIWQVRLIFFSFNSAKLKKKREMCVQTQPWNSRATNQFCLWRYSGPGHLNADKLSWGHWTCFCDFGDVYICSIYFGWFILKSPFTWAEHYEINI